ncbi:MAG: hypothetical protein JWN68_700 [Nocardioides sp.]|jgi:hypothetical protein|nr:hypothetical protein [Nocardioides sp.]
MTATWSLTFDDGRPVRAASAIVAYADGWLIAQDDSTLGALWRDSTAVPLRLLDPVDGLDSFSSDEGTKHLKPDLESACVLPDGTVMVMGSGSSHARCRAVALTEDARQVEDLTELYARVEAALRVPAEVLNLEGACVVGDHLRWFHRGLPAGGWPSGSVDLPLGAPLTRARPTNVLRYDLGSADGVGLAATDAVALADGLVLVSAAAEDSPNTYDDGPVVGSALVLLDGAGVVDTVEIPRLHGRVAKVEGLALVAEDDSGVRLIATIDADDADSPSPVIELTVRR